MQLQSVTALFNKRMDRREFLRTILLIALTLVGLGMIAKNIGTTRTSGSAPAPTAAPQSGDLYGK